MVYLSYISIINVLNLGFILQYIFYGLFMLIKELQVRDKNVSKPAETIIVKKFIKH